jgi:hypothetical protein
MKKIIYTSGLLFLLAFFFSTLLSQKHISSYTDIYLGRCTFNQRDLSLLPDTIPKKSVNQSIDSSKNNITQDSLKNLLKKEIESKGQSKNLKPKIH